jgi:hypothetical protein
MSEAAARQAIVGEYSESGIDNSCRCSVGSTGNELAEAHVGIHARCLVQEKDA